MLDILQDRAQVVYEGQVIAFGCPSRPAGVCVCVCVCVSAQQLLIILRKCYAVHTNVSSL